MCSSALQIVHGTCYKINEPNIPPIAGTHQLIISPSGLFPCGLGVWLNEKLQPIIKEIDSFASSSRSFKEAIMEKSPFGTRVRLCGADARGMFNNAKTDHLLENIKTFLQEHEICKKLKMKWKPICDALVIVMTAIVKPVLRSYRQRDPLPRATRAARSMTPGTRPTHAHSLSVTKQTPIHS